MLFLILFMLRLDCIIIIRVLLLGLGEAYSSLPKSRQDERYLSIPLWMHCYTHHTLMGTHITIPLLSLLTPSMINK